MNIMNDNNEINDLMVVKSMLADIGALLKDMAIRQEKLEMKVDNYFNQQQIENKNIAKTGPVKLIDTPQKSTFLSKNETDTDSETEEFNTPITLSTNDKTDSLSEDDIEDEKTIQVKSFLGRKNDDGNSIYYDVKVAAGVCNCPDFQYHGPKECKHLRDVVQNYSNYGLTWVQHDILKKKLNTY